MKLLKESLNSNELIILSDKFPKVPDDVNVVISVNLSIICGVLKNPDDLFSHNIDKIFFITGGLIDIPLRDISNIKKVYFDESIHWIEPGAISGCLLNECILPNMLKEIPGCMFKDCTNLKKIIIPNNVQKVGSYAFNYCRRLEEIIFTKNVEKVGQYCFIGCDKLKKITCTKEIKELLLKDGTLPKKVKFTII